MHQVLHIFRKDVRRLRWEILAALAVTALFAWAQTHHWRTDYNGVFNNISISSFVVLAWWYLVARVVHEEPLVGDREFWLSRPYSRKSLVAAKCLFMVVFISLPMLAVQCFLLQSAGLFPFIYFAGLLMRQGLLATLVVLPAAALAAMTPGLVRFALAGLGVVSYCFVLFLLWKSTPGWLTLYEISVQLLLVATVVILVLQYGWRRTKASLGTLSCAGILILFLSSPFVRNKALAWEYPVSQSVAGGATISLNFDSTRTDRKQYEFGYQTKTTIRIPLQVEGLPEGTNLEPDGVVELSIDAPGGRSWHASWTPRASAWNPLHPPTSEGKPFADVYVDRQFFEQVKSEPITLRASLAFTSFRRQMSSVRLSPSEFSATIPNVGVCSFERGWQGDEVFWSNWMLCRSAFDWPTKVWIEAEAHTLCTKSSTGGAPPDSAEYRRRLSQTATGPFLPSNMNPVGDFGISRPQWSRVGDVTILNPVRVFPLDFPTPDFDWDGGHVHAWPCTGTWLVFTTRTPVARFRRDLEISNLRLADYVSWNGY
jgi:hypothetical protein